jgi:hypothetical protein
MIAVPYATLLFHVRPNAYDHFKTSQAIILQMSELRVGPNGAGAM